MSHACPRKVHEAIRTNDARWEAETRPTSQYIGGPPHEKRQVQHGLEYAVCNHCDGGITRPARKSQPVVIDLAEALRNSLRSGK